MANTITSYAALQAYINQLINKYQIALGPPHGDFWNTLTYQQFVTGNVPHVNPPTPILIKGDPEHSNIIMVLRGPGSPSGPNNPNFPQMPEGGPYFSDADIQPIADWIKANCPE